RVDKAVPGRLLEHEQQVVVGGDGQVVVADPAELGRLAFEALYQHVVDLIEDSERDRRPDALDASPEEAHGERVHRVTGVHRDRHADTAVHRGDAAARVTAVL